MTATPSADGSSYVLTGSKLWTTNGVVAELLVVMARVPGGPKGGITAFVVEADSPGITVENRNAFMGLRGLENGVTRFDEVRVPAENVIGAVGDGLKIALTTLNTGRLSIPAMCTAAAKWSLKVAREWSRERVQWGRPIAEHAAVAHKIGFIAATTFALEAVLDLSAQLADEGRNDIRIEAALAKLWSSEMAWRVADELVQIRGGRGYETAESLAARGERAVPAEQMLRDLRINRIFEGSTEIMHLLIAREAVDTHLAVAGAIIDPYADVAAKLRAGVRAGGFYAGWLPRLAAGPGMLPTSYDEFGPLAPHLRYVERASRRLARSTFYGMARWQGRLEHKQGFLGRIVDIGAELFAISAACVRAEMLRAADPAEGAAAYELADAFAAQSRLRVEALFRALWRNSDGSDERLARRTIAGPLHLAGGRHHRPVRRRPVDRLDRPGPPAPRQPRPPLPARPPAHPSPEPAGQLTGSSQAAHRFFSGLALILGGTRSRFRDVEEEDPHAHEGADGCGRRNDRRGRHHRSRVRGACPAQRERQHGRRHGQPEPLPVGSPDQPANPPDRRLERIKDALSDLVSAGTLTQKQADAVAKKLGEIGVRGPHGPGGPHLHAGRGGAQGRPRDRRQDAGRHHRGAAHRPARTATPSPRWPSSRSVEVAEAGRRARHGGHPADRRRGRRRPAPAGTGRPAQGAPARADHRARQRGQARPTRVRAGPPSRHGRRTTGAPSA